MVSGSQQSVFVLQSSIFVAQALCILDLVCFLYSTVLFVLSVIIALGRLCVGVLAFVQQSYVGTELRLNIY